MVRLYYHIPAVIQNINSLCFINGIKEKNSAFDGTDTGWAGINVVRLLL